MVKLSAKSSSGSGFLIFLGWLCYTSSYLGKVNYSANITQIIDFYSVSKSEAGLVPTFFFFAYGIGQIINGLLCKKYNIKWMIFSSLFISGGINLIIAISDNFTIIKWLWLINGFVLSVLWPTIIRLLSENLPKKDLSKSSVVMGTTVAIGTLVIYGLSSIFAIFSAFKLAFYVAAISDIIIAFIWYFSFNTAISNAARQKNISDAPQALANESSNKHTSGSYERKNILLIIVSLCIFAVGVNLIKDGLTTWVPSILKDEYGFPDYLSILLTIILPLIAIFGNMTALAIHKAIPDYVTHCFVVFSVSGVLILGIIGILRIDQAILMLISLVIVYFLTSSLNSVVTSIFPMFMRGQVNSGLIAGILNGCCYAGSTISSYGLGVIAENFGWSGVFITLFAFCAFTFIVWIIYKALRHSFKEI